MRRSIFTFFLSFATALSVLLPNSDNSTAFSTTSSVGANNTALLSRLSCNPQVNPVNFFDASVGAGKGVAWYFKEPEGNPDWRKYVYQVG